MNYDDVCDIEARKKKETSLRFRVEGEKERERDVSFLLHFFLIEEIEMITSSAISSFYHSQTFFLSLIILIIFDRLASSSLNIATSFITAISRTSMCIPEKFKTGFVSASSIFDA